MDALGRRAFLALLPAGVLAALGATRPGHAAGHAAGHATRRAAGYARAGSRRRPAGEHPEPRPGIDGSNVLGADELVDAPHAVEVFDGIREIAHVADGIRCHCGCADLPGYRSLLSCYESPGMARWCEICQGAGRLAVRRTREGQSLDQIRRAIDARWGPRA